MRRVALVLLLIPLGACATRGDLQDLQSEVRDLHARQDSTTAALHRAIAEASRATMDSVRALSGQMFDFRGNASGNMREMEKGLEGLEEVLGQFQRTVDQLRDEMDQQQREFDRKLAQMATAGDSTVDAGAAEVPDPAEPPGTPADGQDLFDAAAKSLERGLYTAAHRGFTQFLDQYPQSALAPPAYLHRGEVLTQQGQLEEAIADYLDVPRFFPTSEWIPAALYRAGALCIELEDYDRARQYLERLVNTYPDDAFAEQAQAKLDDIP